MSKIHLPATPPAAPPTARRVPCLGSIFVSPPRLLKTDTTLIARTVHPDRKLMVETSMPETASITGLMITSPPMPEMAPRVVETRQIRKYKMDRNYLLL